MLIRIRQYNINANRIEYITDVQNSTIPFYRIVFGHEDVIKIGPVDDQTYQGFVDEHAALIEAWKLAVR